MSDDVAVRWYTGLSGTTAHAYTVLRRDRYRARACDSTYTVGELLLIQRPAPEGVESCGDCVTIVAGMEAQDPWRVERDMLLLNIREMGAALDAARARIIALEANFATAKKCLRDAAEERDYWKKGSRAWCERAGEESLALDAARAEIAELRIRADRDAWLLDSRNESAREEIERLRTKCGLLVEEPRARDGGDDS